MENSLKIKSSFKKYSVAFVNNLDYLQKLAGEDETFFAIDKNVFDLYRASFPEISEKRTFIIEAFEFNKNMDTVLEICEKMTTMASKRNTHLVSIGGGIVQDITGFVATSLYRGIKWTFYPSTLLAACDSCIGGKSSLNFKTYKNLLGSFYPPDEIKIYPQFFSTLTARDYCSGLGEVLKFNVIAGEKFLEKIEYDLDDLVSRNHNRLIQYVRTSLKFKKKFIEEDEFDRGDRVLLNFAHTFGHAYESVSNYEIPHGSAVALGMLAANYISYKRGFITKEYNDRIENCVKKILKNIKIDASWFDMDKILGAIRKDKKQTSNSINAVLIVKDGKLAVFKDIEEAEIDEAVKYVVSVSEISVE